MTEKELDAFMSKVLLDAIAFDEDRLEEKSPMLRLHDTGVKCERC